MWPLFSQHEADEITEHMHESTGLFATSAFHTTTVASALQQYLKLNDERTLQVRPDRSPPARPFSPVDRV